MRAELPDRFVVAYCDTFIDIDLDRLNEYHDAQDAGATLVTAPIQQVLGVVQRDEGGMASSFVEKPIQDYFIGYFMMERRLLESLPEELVTWPDGAGIVELFQKALPTTAIGCLYPHRVEHFNTDPERLRAERELDAFFTLRENRVNGHGSNRDMVKDLGGKKVLVTGGGGFIGSHLTRRLVDLGAEVAVLTKYESIVDNVRLAALWDDILPIEGDLRNLIPPQPGRFRAGSDFSSRRLQPCRWQLPALFRSARMQRQRHRQLIECLSDYERFVYISSSEVYVARKQFPSLRQKSPNRCRLTRLESIRESFTAG